MYLFSALYDRMVPFPCGTIVRTESSYRQGANANEIVKMQLCGVRALCCAVLVIG